MWCLMLSKKNARCDAQVVRAKTAFKILNAYKWRRKIFLVLCDGCGFVLSCKRAKKNVWSCSKHLRRSVSSTVRRKQKKARLNSYKIQTSVPWASLLSRFSLEPRPTASNVITKESKNYLTVFWGVSRQDLGVGALKFWALACQLLWR